MHDRFKQRSTPFLPPLNLQGGQRTALHLGDDPTEEVFVQHLVPASPAVEAIHAAARNENSVMFRLDHLREMAGVPHPEPAVERVTDLPDAFSHLDKYASAAPPPPPLLHTRVVSRPAWVLPATLGGFTLLVLTAFVLLMVVVLQDDPTGTAAAATAAAPARPSTVTPESAHAVAPKVKTPAARSSAPGKGAAAAPRRIAPRATESPRARRPAVAPVTVAERTPRVHRTTGKKKISKRQARRRRIKQRRARARKARRARRARKIAARRARKARRIAARRVRRRRASRSDDVDDLLSEAAPKKTRKRQPARLNRDQIMRGMKGVKRRVVGCFQRYQSPGMAKVKVIIGQNGRVRSARINGVFSGTPTGACIRAAARAASFPRFDGPAISIIYPFVMRQAG